MLASFFFTFGLISRHVQHWISISKWNHWVYWLRFGLDMSPLPLAAVLLLLCARHTPHDNFTFGHPPILACKLESKINAWPLPLQFSNAANKKKIPLPIAQADATLGGCILSILRQLRKINLKGKKHHSKHCNMLYDLKRISCNLKCWRLLSQKFYNRLCGSLVHCYRKF